MFPNDNKSLYMRQRNDNTVFNLLYKLSHDGVPKQQEISMLFCLGFVFNLTPPTEKTSGNKSGHMTGMPLRGFYLLSK